MIVGSGALFGWGPSKTGTACSEALFPIWGNAAEPILEKRKSGIPKMSDAEAPISLLRRPHWFCGIESRP